MKYDPKFPYRINGGQVSAGTVGVGIPMPGNDERALEVTCTRKGITLELEGEEVESVHISASELRQRYYREVNERNKEQDEEARYLAEAERRLDDATDWSDDRRAMLGADLIRRVKDMGPHARGVERRIWIECFRFDPDAFDKYWQQKEES